MTGQAYYNENDPFAAARLRNLIAAGFIADGCVDDRSIIDVEPDDLKGFEQCHFFAGIGGWSYALRLAGWPDGRPVWTGSCPCQPFSAAGKGGGVDDPRHLWPAFRWLIAQCRPPLVTGEQVVSAKVVGTKQEAAFLVAIQAGEYAKANKLAKRLVASRSFHHHQRWLDGVRADMEALGYAFRHIVLGAHSVGAPHIRQRLWWVADANVPRRAAAVRGQGLQERNESEQGRGAMVGGLADARCWGREALGAASGEDQPETDFHDQRRGTDGGLADADGLERRLPDEQWAQVPEVERGGTDGGLADANEQGREGGRSENVQGQDEQQPAESGFWSDFDLIPCADGKARRIESGTFPLAHGVPARVGLLRGYGNAIVPQVAAEVVTAYLEARTEQK